MPDVALVLGGVVLSALLVSALDPGTAFLEIAVLQSGVALATGLVSLAMARLVRTVPLAIVASIVISEMLFFLYFVCRVAYSRQVHEHAFEELYLLPLVFALYTAPTVALSAAGFGRIGSRLQAPRRP